MTSSHKIVIINEASLEVLNLKANKEVPTNIKDEGKLVTRESTKRVLDALGISKTTWRNGALAVAGAASITEDTIEGILALVELLSTEEGRASLQEFLPPGFSIDDNLLCFGGNCFSDVDEYEQWVRNIVAVADNIAQHYGGIIESSFEGDPFAIGQLVAEIAFFAIEGDEVRFIRNVKFADKGAAIAKISDDVLKLARNGDNLFIRKGDDIIVSGNSAVDKIIAAAHKIDDLPYAKTVLNKLDDTDFLSRVDDLTLDELLALDDLYDPSKFKLPSNRPTVSGQKAKSDFNAWQEINGKTEFVYFDDYGFPRFENNFSPGPEFVYKSDNLLGNGTSTDFTEATKWLKEKYPNKNIVKDNNRVIIEGKTYTWHHHQDGKSLLPVLTEVHGGFRHSGGNAVITRGLKGLFDGPLFF